MWPEQHHVHSCNNTVTDGHWREGHEKEINLGFILTYWSPSHQRMNTDLTLFKIKSEPSFFSLPFLMLFMNMQHTLSLAYKSTHMIYIWTKSSKKSYRPVKQSFVVQEGRESHFYCLIAGNYAGPVMKQIINHSETCLYVQDKGRVQIFRVAFTAWRY